MRNIVGTPARGDDFFDREAVVALIWERLETGNVLLAAPRRFGKTSLMYRLIDDPRPGWLPVHVDAESIREPVNFVLALLDGLMAQKRVRKFLLGAWAGAAKWIRDLFDGWEVETPWDVKAKIHLKKELSTHWPARSEALLRVLRKYDAAKRLLLVVDELPLMLQLFRDNDVNASDAKAFLYWFRRLRQDPGIGLTNCRFLVGGSIGIDHELTRVGAAAAFNDFERIPLRELAADRARGFLNLLLADRDLNLGASARRQVLAQVGAPVPYFLQVFVSEIAAQRRVGAEDRIGPKTVERIYHDRVLGVVCKGYFQHYYDRLRYYERPMEAAAKAILRELALAQPDSVPRDRVRTLFRNALGEDASDEGFAALVADLENDFYIRYLPEAEGYLFASKVLCDWWRRYYAF